MKFEKVQISKGILYIAKAKLREVLLKKKSLKCWLFVHISNLTAYKANFEIEKKSFSGSIFCKDHSNYFVYFALVCSAYTIYDIMKFACTMWSNVWGGAFTENGRDSNIWPRGLKMTASSSRQAGVCYILASNMSDTKKYKISGLWNNWNFKNS